MQGSKTTPKRVQKQPIPQIPSGQEAAKGADSSDQEQPSQPSRLALAKEAAKNFSEACPDAEKLLHFLLHAQEAIFNWQIDKPGTLPDARSRFFEINMLIESIVSPLNCMQQHTFSDPSRSLITGVKDLVSFNGDEGITKAIEAIEMGYAWQVLYDSASFTIPYMRKMVSFYNALEILDRGLRKYDAAVND